MAIGDGVRRNVAQVSAAERARLRDAFIALGHHQGLSRRCHLLGQAGGHPQECPRGRPGCALGAGFCRGIGSWSTGSRRCCVRSPRSCRCTTGTGPPTPPRRAGLTCSRPTSWARPTATRACRSELREHRGRRAQGHMARPQPWRSTRRARRGRGDQRRHRAGIRPVSADERCAAGRAQHRARLHRRLDRPAALLLPRPAVFLLHSNADRLFAMWQLALGHAWRLVPDRIYGSAGTAPAIISNLEPWAGGEDLRPWAPPDNQQLVKNCKDLSVVTPPLYDTNPRVVTTLSPWPLVRKGDREHPVRRCSTCCDHAGAPSWPTGSSARRPKAPSGSFQSRRASPPTGSSDPTRGRRSSSRSSWTARRSRAGGTDGVSVPEPLR